MLFAFLSKAVPEWSGNGFVQGILYVYVNSNLHLDTLWTTTLSDDIYFAVYGTAEEQSIDLVLLP